MVCTPLLRSITHYHGLKYGVISPENYPLGNRGPCHVIADRFPYNEGLVSSIILHSNHPANVVMAQFIRGERGGNLVLYTGFIYKKKESKGAKDYYQCNHPGCTVKLHTLLNTLNVVHYNGNRFHQHPPPDDAIISSVLIEEMKIRIDADPTKHLPKMWEEVLHFS